MSEELFERVDDGFGEFSILLSKNCWNRERGRMREGSRGSRERVVVGPIDS
jgi:hypothetical protein